MSQQRDFILFMHIVFYGWKRSDIAEEARKMTKWTELPTISHVNCSQLNSKLAEGSALSSGLLHTEAVWDQEAAWDQEATCA